MNKTQISKPQWHSFHLWGTKECFQVLPGGPETKYRWQIAGLKANLGWGSRIHWATVWRFVFCWVVFFSIEKIHWIWLGYEKTSASVAYHHHTKTIYQLVYRLYLYQQRMLKCYLQPLIKIARDILSMRVWHYPKGYMGLAYLGKFLDISKYHIDQPSKALWLSIAWFIRDP